MFARQDEQFDRMAADPARRRAGIADLSLRRSVLFCCAVVMTLCALMVFFGSNRTSGGGAAIGFGSATMWMLVFKFESDLRLLRVVERLHLAPK